MTKAVSHLQRQWNTAQPSTSSFRKRNDAPTSSGSTFQKRNRVPSAAKLDSDLDAYMAERKPNKASLDREMDSYNAARKSVSTDPEESGMETE
jgi:hypothetical protein